MNNLANCLRIVHINVRGIRANGHSLNQYLSRLQFPEIVAINETKLNQSVDYFPENYFCVSRRDSSHGHHGSMILVKNGLDDVSELTSFQNDFAEEVIGIRINGMNNFPSVNICTYYNPPGKYVNPNIFEHCNKLKGATVICGDLNCKNSAWGSTADDPPGDHLLHTINDNNFAILNDGNMTRCDPYYGTEQVLDIVCCNQTALRHFNYFSVGPDIGSDHYPITIEFQHLVGTQTTHTRYLKNTDWDRFKEILKEIPIQKASTLGEVDAVISSLTKTIINAFDTACPLKKKYIRKCSFTPEMLNIVKEKRRLRRQRCAANNEGNQLLASQLQKQINSMNKHLKHLQKQKLREDLNRDCKKLNGEKDSAKFFRLFDRLTNRKHNKPTLGPYVATDDGKMAFTNQEKANLFACHLRNCHKLNDYHGFDDKWRKEVEKFVAENWQTFKVQKTENYLATEPGDDHQLLDEITVEEIADNLRFCKNKSASGEDRINYVMLKKIPRNVFIALAEVFNSCMRLGYFPDLWKKASVSMIPKPNKDSRLAKNHRPISLLPCIGKVYERIISKRLSGFMEQKKLFSPYQSGFRKGHKTSEQLLRLIEEASNATKQKKITAALFLDAEAAFDKAWHDGIRHKLFHLGLPHRLIRLISSFLTNRSLTVKVGEKFSTAVQMEAGTPQGSSLSPLLYIILVNDIPKEVTTSASLSQFADDIALWSSAYTHRAVINKLQRSINMLEGWCRRWRIKLNASKSNLLIISRLLRKKSEDSSVMLFDDIVTPVQHGKFLGIEIDDRLSFNKHFDERVKKAKSRLNLFTMLSRGGVDNATMIRLYKTYVRPLFEYGSVATIALNAKNIYKYQKVQNEYLRTCLSLPKYIRTSLLHEAAGLEPIEKRLTELSKKQFNAMKTLDIISDLCIEYHKIMPLNEFKSPLDYLTVD